jgi:hypothetical protein
MRDLHNKIGAYPIDYSLYKELETGCDRAVPNIESIVNIFEEFFSLSKKQRQAKSKETRALFEENYSWDKTANQWAKVIDDCPYADWDKPPNIISPKPINKENPSTYAFINEVITNYTYYPPHANSALCKSLLTDLHRGLTRVAFDGYYTSEFSPFGESKPKPINRDMIIKMFTNRLNNYNQWENARVNRSQLKKEEKWLN